MVAAIQMATTPLHQEEKCTICQYFGLEDQ